MRPAPHSLPFLHIDVIREIAQTQKKWGLGTTKGKKHYLNWTLTFIKQWAWSGCQNTKKWRQFGRVGRDNTSSQNTNYGERKKLQTSIYVTGSRENVIADDSSQQLLIWFLAFDIALLMRVCVRKERERERERKQLQVVWLIWQNTHTHA